MIDRKAIKRNILSLRKYSWFNVLLKPYHVIKFTNSYIHSIKRGQIYELIKKHISNSLSERNRNRIVFDIFLSNLKYGSSVKNYFDYKFYEKPHKERKKYITQDIMGRYHYSFNPAKYHYVFHEKQHTYQIFRQYIGRDFLYISETVTFNDFVGFCKNRTEIFIKPSNESWGRGTQKIKLNDNIDLEDIYQECLKKNLIVEEVILQDPELAAFNPSSLNTIRLTTVLTKNGIRIMEPAYFKIGSGDSITDNFSSGGLLSGVNIKNGEVYKCIDKNGNQYFEHPLTKKQIVGFVIPEWKRMITFVKELALIVPEIKFVGWDITLSNDDTLVLLEGNEKGDLYTLEEVKTKAEYDEALRLI